jgi:hypothetical protein
MKVNNLVRIDRNIGTFASELPEKSGALEKITRDIIYYIAKNAGDINYTLHKEFKWNTADYLRTVKTSRSKLVMAWDKALSDEEQNFLFTKYPDPREREGYEWVVTKLDLAFYVLSQLNLSYSEQLAVGRYRTESFLIFKSIDIQIGKNNQKTYTCSVDDSFLDRCLKSAYFNLMDYPNVPQKHRSLHLYLNSIRDKAYYLGFLQSGPIPIDEIAKIKGIDLTNAAKTRKQTIIRSIESYLSISDELFNSAIDSYAVIDKDNKEVKNGYYIRFIFKLDPKVTNSPFRLDKNEAFIKVVYTKLEELYDLYYEATLKKWGADHLVPGFDEWMKIGMEDTFFKSKISIYSKGFKKVFNKDLKDFPGIYKKTFNIESLPKF